MKLKTQFYLYVKMSDAPLPCFHRRYGISSPLPSSQEPPLYMWWIRILSSSLSLDLAEAQWSQSMQKEKNILKPTVTYLLLPVPIMMMMMIFHTSPNVPKYSWMTSFEVSGLRPPTKIFLIGSFFIANAFLGSITLPSSLCSFCARTWKQTNLN